MKKAILAVLVATNLCVFAADKPNVIFILSDDHAPTAIGCYNKRLSPFAKTPNIDRLAEEGVRLDAMYCVNAICGPSRASILTGQYGHINGVTGNKFKLNKKRPNVAKELKKLGYETAVIGKWHLIDRPSGFTYYEVLRGQGKYFDPRLYGPKDGTERSDGTIFPDRYSADVIAERSIEWLREEWDDDKPFVLMTHFKACHAPRAYPERFEDLYKEVELPEPPTLFEDDSHQCEGRRGLGLTISETAVERFSKSDWPTGSVSFSGMSPDEKARAAHQKICKDYLRCTAALDEAIGTILDYVEEQGLMDNTVIIYSSDQGYYLGEHNYIDKRWFFNEGVSMPFIVRYPKLFAAGSVNDDIVLNIDIAPFLLELAGGETPDYMQGRSFLANLQGKTPDDWRTAYYYHYWEHNDRPAHYGIQTKTHRLIFFYGLNLDKKLARIHSRARSYKKLNSTHDTDFGWELYDLQNDPFETRNIFNNPENKALAEKLVRQMDEMKEELDDTDKPFKKLQQRRAESGF